MIFANLIAWIVSAQISHADMGGEVPNGGDTVMCTPTSGSPYKGYYSLDYLLTLRDDNSDLVAARSWDDSKKRLLTLLDEKFPDGARLLRDYLSRIPGEDVTLPERYYMEQRLWLEAPYGLLDIKDERMVRKLPPNCYKVHGAPDEIDVIQTVIRQTNRDAIVYNFDPSIMRALKRDAPQQYSFLIVHEWLWDYLGNAEVIRRVNRFLHSNALERLNSDELKLSLRNLGLNFSAGKPTDFCSRTPQLRSELERAMGRSCGQIAEFTSTIFFVPNKGITTLRPGDLAGLERVESLDISRNQIDYLFEDLLASLPRLLKLEASGNQIKRVPPRLLANNPNMSQLNFRDNLIEEIPMELFASFGNTFSVWVSFANNKIKKIPDEMVQLICRNGWFLDLRGNPIKKSDIVGAPVECLNTPNGRLQVDP